MLAKKVTYTDYAGTERTETFYFNLNQAELMEMEVSESGGLQTTINRIIADNDGKRIIETFKAIVLKSYGVPSSDGRRFIKSKELCEEFEQCPAFSDIFMELSTDAEKAAEFINAVISNPKKNGLEVVKDA